MINVSENGRKSYIVEKVEDITNKHYNFKSKNNEKFENAFKLLLGKWANLDGGDENRIDFVSASYDFENGVIEELGIEARYVSDENREKLHNLLERFGFKKDKTWNGIEGYFLKDDEKINSMLKEMYKYNSAQLKGFIKWE